jgi:proteasome assembly chaperone (PAC2) family protein
VNVVTFLQRPRGLHRPVLVAAFQGWNDAGEAASGAARVLRRESSAQPFARIDPEEFFDFQATRPTVRIADGGMRRIDWPENTFSWAHLPGSRHDLVLLNGTEPNLRWVTFARGITDLVSELGIELVLTLGALQIDVPHSRPVPITGSASDAQLATRLRLRRSTYEGPTGITGVLHHACASAGVHAASLWAGVPHYLAVTGIMPGQGHCPSSLTPRVTPTGPHMYWSASLPEPLRQELDSLDAGPVQCAGVVVTHLVTAVPGQLLNHAGVHAGVLEKCVR